MINALFLDCVFIQFKHGYGTPWPYRKDPSCADPEGDRGSKPPPWNIGFLLKIAIGPPLEKLDPPPGKWRTLEKGWTPLKP